MSNANTVWHSTLETKRKLGSMTRPFEVARRRGLHDMEFVLSGSPVQFTIRPNHPPEAEVP